MNTKELILLATLELASEKGLGAISLSQIAKKVGIQKPSLYNHFSSKEDLIQQLYEYLRFCAKQESGGMTVDYGRLVAGHDAQTVLLQAVNTYRKINSNNNMRMFYKLVMSERAFRKEAAQIFTAETERMILATKQLFYAMQIHQVLNFEQIDIAAVSFAMTIKGLLEYEIDQNFAKQGEAAGQEEKTAASQDLVRKYIEYFCRIHGSRTALCE